MVARPGRPTLESHGSFFQALREGLRDRALNPGKDATAATILEYADQILENFGDSAAAREIADGQRSRVLSVASEIGLSTDGDGTDPRHRIAVWLDAASKRSDALSPDDEKVLDTVVRAEQWRQERLAADSGAAPVPDPTAALKSRLTPDAIAAELARLLPGHAPRVMEVDILPGGRSKITTVVSLTDQGDLPAEVVLRQDAEGQIGQGAAEEYPLLVELYRRGVAVPRPIVLAGGSDTGPTALGSDYMVVERVPGSTIGDLWGITGDASTREVALGIARVLAQVHGLDIDPAVVGATDAGTPVQTMSALLDRYQESMNGQEFGRAPVASLGFLWLRRHIERGALRRTFVHGDVGFHNLLVDGDRITALLDWELSHFGEPAEDLAYCRESIEQVTPWEEFLAEYTAHGGVVPTDFQMRYFTVWRAVRNITLCLNATDAFDRRRSADLGMGAAALWALPRFETLILSLVADDFVL